MMKSPLLYIVEMLFCSGVFMLLWRYLLAGRISFVASRWYLLISVVFAAAIPMLNIPLYPVETVYYELPLITVGDDELLNAIGAAETVFLAEYVAAEHFSELSGFVVDWRVIFVAIYFAVSIFFLSMIAVRCIRLAMLRSKSRITVVDGYRIAESEEVYSSFSFIHTVYLSADLEDKYRACILCHECSHIRHHHSLDRIAMEIFRSFLWFNPFVWMSARALSEVHEWEADRDVLDEGCDLTEYRTIIFRQLFGYNPDITCGLGNSITKKRFIMMTKLCGDEFALFRLCAVVPIVAGMIMAFGCTSRVGNVSEGADADTKVLHTIGVSADGYSLDGCDMPLSLIGIELGRISDSLRRETVIDIAADDVAYEKVYNLKQVLRDIDFLRVRYLSDEESVGILRVLPPVVSSNDKQSTVTEIQKIVRSDDVNDGFGNGRNPSARIANDDTLIIKSRNIADLFVAADGRIRVVYDCKSEKIVSDVSELHTFIKKWIVNSDNVADYPTRSAIEVELPNGDKRIVSCSDGLISLHICKEASYDVFYDVQKTLIDTFDDIRNDVAQAEFGRRYADLSENLQRCVVRMVPVKIVEADLIR